MLNEAALLICLTMTVIICECAARLADIIQESIRKRDEARKLEFRIKAYEESSKHRTSNEEKARALAISYVLRSKKIMPSKSEGKNKYI